MQREVYVPQGNRYGPFGFCLTPDCKFHKTGKYAEKKDNMNSTSPLQFALDTLNTEYATANAELDKADKAVREAEKVKEAARVKVIQIKAGIDSIKKLIPVKTTIERYFTASRSYGGPGHYSEKFTDGTWACTCKGFKFNGYCWATDALKSSQTARDRNRFFFGAATFNTRRDAAAQKAFAK